MGCDGQPLERGSPGSIVDPFDLVVPDTALADGYRALRTSPGFAPARQVVRRVFADFHDADGNFCQQFQTAGFDSRTWELYLFAYLHDAGFEIERPSDGGPDFLASKGGTTVAIEATTANPGAEPSRDRTLGPEPSPEHLLRETRHVIPIRLGSPLFSKLRRRYWERPDVAGRPLVFAIESFAGEDSLHFSDTAVATYLYGRWPVAKRDWLGRLLTGTVPITEHVHGSKRIPSGFFFQEGAEHVSAVLFSNGGTVSKFNRMGFQDGLCAQGIDLIRVGTRFDPDPDASEPALFQYRVGSRRETWGEGICVIHNPRALYPLDQSLMPDVAHERLEGDQVVITCPGFHPFSSKTLTLVRRRGGRSGHRGR